MASVPKPDSASARQAFYQRMDRDNLAPLWEVLHALVPPQPQSPCKPGYWNYQAIRPYIMESGRAITDAKTWRRPGCCDFGEPSVDPCADRARDLLVHGIELG